MAIGHCTSSDSLHYLRTVCGIYRNILLVIEDYRNNSIRKSYLAANLIRPYCNAMGDDLCAHCNQSIILW